MSLWSHALAGLRAVIRRADASSELDAELREYYRDAADALVARGVPRPEAERRIRAREGSPTSVREEVEDGLWESVIDGVGRDLTYAMRGLRRTPAFTVATVLTLALGIAATTAMFGVIDAVVLRPLPYADPGRLAVLWTDDKAHDSHEEGTAYVTFKDWRARAHAFSDMGIVSRNHSATLAVGDPERISDALISPNVLPLLGVAPMIGRNFTEQEFDRREAVAILSHGLWVRHFGADAGIVGKTVDIDGAPSRIIGVMPAGFFFPDERVQLWRPATLLAQWASIDDNRFNDWWSVIGRLEKSATMTEARSEMNTIGAQLAAAYVPPAGEDFGGFEVNVVSMRDQVTGSSLPAALFILFAAVSLVPLIACANVASLMLARGAARAREFAVRSALGAGRRRLVRQLLAESFALAGVSAVLGVLACAVALRTAAALGAGRVPRLEAATIDLPSILFAFALALVCALAFGVLPALNVSSASPQELLRSGGRAMTGGLSVRRARGALLVAECALAVALLLGAGLFLRSFEKLRAVDPGYRTSNMLITHVDFRAPARGDGDPSSTWLPTLDRIRGLPGVRTAGAIEEFFFRRNADMNVSVEGREDRPVGGELIGESVSPGFFATMQAPVRRGALPSAAAADGQIVVNETFARRYFPGENAVGRRVREGRGPWMTIAAVVGDMHQAGLDRRPIPVIFQPGFRTSMDVVIATSVPPALLAGSLRAAIHETDKLAAIGSITTLDRQLSAQSSDRQFETWLIASFAAIALVLAVVGIYGVMNYAVSQQSREIGVRIALGASRRRVVMTILRQGMTLAGSGAALGLLIGVVLTRALTHFIFGISPEDPVTFGSVAGLAVIVALVACYVPAARAARIDPVLAFKGD